MWELYIVKLVKNIIMCTYNISVMLASNSVLLFNFVIYINSEKQPTNVTAEAVKWSTPLSDENMKNEGFLSLLINSLVLSLIINSF